MRVWQARLLAFAAAACPAVPVYADSLPTISTQAVAVGRLSNTQADLVLNVDATGKSLTEVQAALSSASTALLPALSAAGARNVHTDEPDVRPNLDGEPPPGRSPHIVGFAGRVRVSLNAAPGSLGAILGEAFTHGASRLEEVVLHPLTAELEAVRNRLTAEATKAAIARAQAAAEAAGARLGAIQSINVTAASSVRQRLARPSSASGGYFSSAAPSFSTEPAESDVTVTVSLVTAFAP